VLGRREADVRNRFKLPPHLTMANFANVGGSHADGTKDGGKDSVGAGVPTGLNSLMVQARRGSFLLVGAGALGVRGLAHRPHAPVEGHPVAEDRVQPEGQRWCGKNHVRSRALMASLPSQIVVKGVMTAEDALMAVQVKTS
jgi:hypothetical protein